ncbi:hypothetical protein OUZ56_022065 [Daphnia magna]|uniref:Uncharacterized protein n=1 Tax=Daphnia magna TaxID=35525 RepID=A0ABR0AVB3_9CRUS|nr:hypothetical protein OUZ56_022065 [Daphnia magna]
MEAISDLILEGNRELQRKWLGLSPTLIGSPSDPILRAYLMVKACKLECSPMTARGFAKFPILSPVKSQSEEKRRRRLRRLAFKNATSVLALRSLLAGSKDERFHREKCYMSPDGAEGIQQGPST